MHKDGGAENRIVAHHCKCKVEIKYPVIAVRQLASPLWELTYYMGSHSVTCHPAEETFPPSLHRGLNVD